MKNSKRFARAGMAFGIAATLVLAAPLAASAHVHVDPEQASPGSYSTLTFKVPTESATASTVKLEVDLPTDAPFGSVSYQPVPGWSTEVVTSTLSTPVTTDDGTVTEAPTRVVWTADAATAPAVAGIAPGQFDLFSISAGPVPDTGSVLLPVHQTYSDGSVVDWVDAPLASGAEPEHPAPVLYITDPAPVEGAATGAAVTATPVAGAAGETSATTSSSASSSAVTVSTVVALAALVLAAIALVVAVLAVTRRARKPAGE